MTVSLPPARAFLFDLDGTLVDSNAMHVASWAEVARRRGLPMRDPEHIGKCGMRTTAVIREILRWPVDDATADAIADEKESLYREWIATRGIDSVPGAVDFVKQAAARGISCAIATSASPENLDACLRVLELRPLFSAFVTGDDVSRGKPAPDIFLLAAERLGVPPQDCLVFEDAPAGVAAAHAAGCRVVALLTSHDPAELSAADLLLPDFRPLLPANSRPSS